MNTTLYYRLSRSDELFKTEARETKCFYITDDGRKIPKKSMEFGSWPNIIRYYTGTPEIIEQYRHCELIRKYRQRLGNLVQVSKKTPDDVMLKIMEITENWREWL